MGAAYQVQAEYRQFYLMDAKLEPPMPEQISDDDVSCRVHVAPNIAVFHALEDGLVSVTVDVAGAPPPTQVEAWDHIVEFSIDAPSGALIISGAAGYLPAQPRIEVPAGSLRGRAGFRASHGREACQVSLWPAPAEARRVLKRK